MYSSPLSTYSSLIRTSKTSTVKHISNTVDASTSIPIVQRSSHPDLKRISAQTVNKLKCAIVRKLVNVSFFRFSWQHYYINKLKTYWSSTRVIHLNTTVATLMLHRIYITKLIYVHFSSSLFQLRDDLQLLCSIVSFRRNVGLDCVVSSDLLTVNTTSTIIRNSCFRPSIC